jgi:hypothetical protein
MGNEGTPESAAEALLADGSLLALADGFAISALALVPGLTLAFVVLPLAGLAFFWVLKVGIRLARSWREATMLSWLQAMTPTAVALTIAGSQVYLGALLFLYPNDPGVLRGLAITVVGYYGVALLRSWMLVGGARHGLRAALTSLRTPSSARR